MHIGTITIDPNAWANFNDLAAVPARVNPPLTSPPSPAVNLCSLYPLMAGCPGAPPVDPLAAALAQQGVCTCVNGTCVENGNSCSTVAVAGPVGSPAYIAQQAALQQAAVDLQNKQAGQWFPGIGNSTILIAGAVVAGAIFFARRR